MTVRELVVLSTAGQAPTRTRHHDGHLLRWDGEGLLFDLEWAPSGSCRCRGGCSRERAQLPSSPEP